ncbi:MAG: hypothetical protein WED33_06025, partial [Bacteroidia bacterium]
MLRILLLLMLFSSTISAQDWVRKTDMPGPGRFWAASFICQDKLYTGTGRPEFSSSTRLADMWQYDFTLDTWTQVADFLGGGREGSTAFSYNGRGFVAFGTPFIQFTSDVWEYLPMTDSWQQKASCPASFAFSHGFVIDDHFYIGPVNGSNKMYSYDIINDSWSEVASFPGADRRAQVSFTANGKGYIGMGAGVFGGVEDDFFRYDPASDSWEQIASISPTSDQSAAFSIDNVGYVYNAGGSGGGKSIYRYDETLNAWELVSTKPEERIANCSMVSYGGSAYLTAGELTISGSNNSSQQIWEFTPLVSSIPETINEKLNVISISSNSIQLNFTGQLSGECLIEIYSLNGSLI